MKKVLAYMLCFVMTIYFTAVCFANEDSTMVSLTKPMYLQKGQINQDISYSILSQEGIYSVECENTQTGRKEIASLEGNKIVDRWYENGVVVSESVFEIPSLIVEEININSETKEIIDSVVKSTEQQANVSAKLLQTKFMQSGVNCTVQAVEDGFVIDPTINIDTSYATAATFTIGSAELLAAFPAYNKTLSAQTNFTSSLNGSMKTMSCKITRNSYVVNNRQSFNIWNGMGLAAASLAVCINPASLLNLCSMYIASGAFIADVLISRPMKAYANALTQACTYDETNYHREVSVYSENGTENFIVTQASDNAPYGWSIVAPGFFTRYPASNIIQQGINSWNTNMSNYGYWKWGDL